MIPLALALSCSSASPAPTGSPSLPSGWSLRDAAGLRIAVPAAWVGPEVSEQPAIAWITFRDASGAEALTLMTWRGTTARELATKQYTGEAPKGDAPHDVQLSDAGMTRTAIALTGFASWHDSSNSGSYECRHLFIDLERDLVVDVIACGAHVRGTSTPTPEARRVQEQVAVRVRPT